jgi:hypothetical protein
VHCVVARGKTDLEANPRLWTGVAGGLIVEADHSPLVFYCPRQRAAGSQVGLVSSFAFLGAGETDYSCGATEDPRHRDCMTRSRATARRPQKRFYFVHCSLVEPPDPALTKHCVEARKKPSCEGEIVRTYNRRAPSQGRLSILLSSELRTS